MQVTIEYNREADMPAKEEMTIYAIEKLLGGLTIKEVNQVLGRVAERINRTLYQTPRPRYEDESYNQWVIDVVKANIDGLADKVAGELAKISNPNFVEIGSNKK